MIQRSERFLKKFFHNRRGTAEVIGTIMFIVILIFFFSNVYLWHDQETRQMNTMLSEKMNTPVSLTATSGGLNVTNNGGDNVILSRLWINDSLGSHVFANLENVGGHQVLVPAGSTITFALGGTTQYDGSSIKVTWGNPITINYAATGTVTFKILTTLGNTASSNYPPTGLTVIGDFLPDYHSFQWAVFDSVSLQNQSAWTPGWNVNVQNPTSNVCFRINVTYHGNGTTALSSNTQLGFEVVQGAANDKNYFESSYIVNCTVANGDKVFTLNAYNNQNQQTFNAGQTITLYFYANSPSTTDGLHFDQPANTLSLWVNLMIYNTSTYGQSFPLVAISYIGP